MLTIIGQHPFDRSSGEAAARGAPQPSRIATIFPNTQTLVTLPGIHATQRMAYADALNRRRSEAGQPPLTEAELAEEWRNSVDLIVEDGKILIRPDPGNMEAAFRADELLQELVSKRRIRFLNALNDKVRRAIKRRGECWRINPLPRSPDEMRKMIAASRIGVGGKEVYYYNRSTGTRFLTCQEFAQLAEMDDAALRSHLVEIQECSARQNRYGHPEVAFFAAGSAFSAADLAAYDFSAVGTDALHQAHEALSRKFQEATPPALRQDNPDNLEWRNRMFAALIGAPGEAVSEETLLGLSSEFFMQIEWLAGGRVEQGELIFDPLFDEKDAHPGDEELSRLCDDKARGFIFNFIREHGDLEYANIGRVVGPLASRAGAGRRRGVYIAEVMPRGAEKEIVKILRLQKWGVFEHLEAGRSLLDAIMRSEEYTEYILDRRLACRQLGMNLPTRIGARKTSERYAGQQREFRGTILWTPYFERDYVYGMATDKIAPGRFQNGAFATRFAVLLGAAAAPNMIVGRVQLDGGVIFDDGNEVVILSEKGLPMDLEVTDPTGCFNDYRTDLRSMAASYAGPIIRRREYVADWKTFASAYLQAFERRFRQIQGEYRSRRRAFDTLFRHQKWDEAGGLAYRWAQVLARLDRADPAEIAALIESRIRENGDTILLSG